MHLPLETRIFMLSVIGMIFGEGNDYGQIVKLRKDGVIFHEGPIETRLIISDDDQLIKIMSYIPNHDCSPTLIGSFLSEISTVVEYSCSKFNIFFQVNLNKS